MCSVGSVGSCSQSGLTQLQQLAGAKPLSNVLKVDDADGDSDGDQAPESQAAQAAESPGQAPSPLGLGSVLNLLA